jgi:hypothetical protein
MGTDVYDLVYSLNQLCNDVHKHLHLLDEKMKTSLLR